eukprot:TRINITY_DN17829_c1_g1_i1.p1 TRINITY_DN17829_c1_g1~~TRINITY_DN17829_c1_g1_i1.p1  ORF type:complete len:611 (+),score=148.89 TRINITY_DN17829_c1_g1_i1:32-1834(+)
MATSLRRLRQLQRSAPAFHQHFQPSSAASQPAQPAQWNFQSIRGCSSGSGNQDRSNTIRDRGRVTGPRYYPSLSQTLRNTRGRELLRIVDTAVPNLKDEEEFNVILKALALDGQWRRSIRLVREMKEVGIEPTLVTYNWILSAMQKDKQVEKALSMLTEMSEKDITPNLHSYNHSVGACKPNEWAKSLHILRNMMPAAGIEPDGQSFEHAAAACEEASEWQRSLSLFLEIGERGLSSTSVGHNYALSACRQGKRWQHGLEIMASMAEKNFEPDFRLKLDIEAQSRGLDRAPPPEPSSRSMPSPDNVWQRKQQLRELREQDKRRQEEKRLEEQRKAREEKDKPAAAEGKQQQPTAAPQQQQKQQQEQQQQRRQQQAQQQDQQQQQQRQRRPPQESTQQQRQPSQQQADSEQRSARVEEDLSKRPRWEESSPRERRPDQRRFEGERRDDRRAAKPRGPRLRAPGSYVLPVFAQHDRSNHAERQALIKVIARVQEASGAKTDAEFEAECAEVTGTVRLYASHTPCISCMACFCQFQRLFPKVKLCVDFDDWRDTRRMVELARREEEHKRRGTSPPNYDCPGLSDMSDEEVPEDVPENAASAQL